MNSAHIRQRILDLGIIAAIRTPSSADALFAAQTLSLGGVPIVEITLTTPGALEVIAELARNHPQVIAGAGTVLDVPTARRCLAAGAAFLTSPGFDADVVEFAVKEGCVVFPGALTPTDIIAACRSRPDFVKVFPCSLVGGPAYIRALRGPFPHVPLIASGGVTQDSAAAFIGAGAAALGIGSALVPPEAVRLRQSQWIAELARRFARMVKDARAQIA